MKRRATRIFALVLSSFLMVSVSFASAGSDNFQDHEFKLQQHPDQYMPGQWNIAPIGSDSSGGTLPQSTVLWRSFEAGGLTHLSDHIEMFDRSINLLQEGLTRQQLGSSVFITPRGQLIWAINPIKTSSGEFMRGFSTGLHFGGALARDWDMMEKGSWSIPTSHTLEAVGTYGLGELSSWSDIRVRSLGSELKSPVMKFSARWSYGLPDAVTGAASQIGRRSLRPNIDETTNYLDSIGMTAAGYASSALGLGSSGAIIFKATAVTGRFVTYPLFESMAMRGTRREVLNQYHLLEKGWEAHGLPAKSMVEVYGAKDLQRWGFGSDITGLPSNSRMNNLLGTQQTRYEQVTSIPINRISNFGNTRIEQQGFIQVNRIISTPTNILDRQLFKTGFLSPDSLFDPGKSSITTTRQWSITTRETTTPNFNKISNWNSNIIYPSRITTTPLSTNFNINPNFGTLSNSFYQKNSLNSSFSVSPVVVGYTNPITSRNETMVLSRQTFDTWTKWSQQQSIAQQKFNQSIINSTGQQQLNQWINNSAGQQQWLRLQQTTPITNFNTNRNSGATKWLNSPSFQQQWFGKQQWNQTQWQNQWKQQYPKLPTNYGYNPMKKSIP